MRSERLLAMDRVAGKPKSLSDGYPKGKTDRADCQLLDYGLLLLRWRFVGYREFGLVHDVDKQTHGSRQGR